MSYILGIDIGTTNIEYAFADSFGHIKSNKCVRNPLSRFGLDVMTRITRANEGRLDEMAGLLRTSLKEAISTMLAQSNLTVTDIQCINIAANTTMVHILMNYDCTYLGKYPFSPVHTEAISTDSLILGINPVSSTSGISLDYPIPVNITRGFSAFVGGDIYSGLKTLPDCDDYLFIDLGTNAEMVLLLGSTAYITSAAAGPAFETCAVGHATDAIDGLVYMLDHYIVDDTGLLSDEYFDQGYDYQNMHFSQKKIRDIQMAKSAIRTGIELLIKESSADTSALKVYIAGTFGYNLNIPNSIRLGMFPSWFNNCSTAVGNTALKGTFLSKDDTVFNTCYQNISDKIKIREIVLANIPDFNDLYIEYMNF